MEKKILIWLESPETEETSAMFTVSHEKRLICKAFPSDRAAECIKEFMDEMNEAEKEMGK